MFGFLCSTRLLLLNRRTTQLSFLHQNGFFIVKSFASIKPSDSTQKLQEQEQEDCFTVSYLINTCGLSPKSALLASRRVVHFENPERPDSVLNFLKENGFTKTHISKIVRLCPHVLLCDIENTLLPKIEFFRSKRASNSDHHSIVSSNPHLLGRSLNEYIIPSYDLLKSVLLVDEKVLRAFKHSAMVNTANNMVPNVSLLRELGVPHSVISSFLMNHPSVVFCNHTRFVGAVNEVKEMGFDPLKTSFVQAIHVFSIMRQPMLESKLELYKKWGWSKEVALLAFKKQPLCMLLSEEKMTKAMDFLVDKMGCLSADIARNPSVISLSLEKRIIPRFSVINILLAKGLVKNDLSLSTFLLPSESRFLQKYVIKFQDDLPQLLNVYRGKMDLLELGSQSEKLKSTLAYNIHCTQGTRSFLRWLPNKAAHEVAILAYSKSQSPVERKNSNLSKRVFLEYAKIAVFGD